MKQKECLDLAESFKTLSDANRLIILSMLTQGELCACKLLEDLNITQPTLSHHMKVLCDRELVSGRKDGKWMHYSLNEKAFIKLQTFLDSLNQSE